MAYFVLNEIFILIFAAKKDRLNFLAYTQNNWLKPEEKLWFRIFMVSCIALFVWVPLSEDLRLRLDTLFCVFMSLTFMWMGLFDPIYNIVAGDNDILYVGKTSGWWSRFMNYFSGIVQLFWRLGFIIISLLFTYKIFK
jgi:hypothetical protein